MRQSPRSRVAAILALLLVGAGAASFAARGAQGETPAPSQGLTPIEMLSLRPEAGSVRVTLSTTPDAPILAARVSASGGGDAATIEEALARVTSGEIGLAAGTYALSPIELPAGVSLAGGFDPQTWKLAPLENPVLLVPSDPDDARPLITLHAGSRLSGLTVRGAAYGIELVGDGVLVEGVGVSHCGLGLLARPESRGLITYTTFVRNTAGAVLDTGSDVALQNSIFHSNGTPLVRSRLAGVSSAIATAASIASANALGDTLRFPLPHRNNLFFGNSAAVAGAPGETLYGSDPGILRVDPVFPDPESGDVDVVPVTLPEVEPNAEGEAPIDSTPHLLASEQFGRPEGKIITAVQMMYDLRPGDRGVLLDAEHGNTPIVTLTGTFSGWVDIPPTRTLALLLETNGDDQFGAPISVSRLGVVDPENLTLDATRDSTRESMTGSTEGGPLGMTGAYDARARWYAPVIATHPAAVLSADDEADLRALEDALVPLTRVGLRGDPAVRDDDGGWVPLDITVGPGQLYRQLLDSPVRSERTINALLSEAGVTRGGALRRVLIEGESLTPALESTATRPIRLKAFSLNGYPEVTLRDATLPALVAAVEQTLEIEPTRDEEAKSYVAQTVGAGASASQESLARLAAFYGADVSSVRVDDTRREVVLADWLKALLARRHGNPNAVPADDDAARCPRPTSCPEFFPLRARALASLPADRETIVLAPSAAQTDGGPWADVQKDAPPLALPLGGRLTSASPLSAVSLRGNGGRAAITFRATATRTAETKLILQRLVGPAMSPVRIRVRSATGDTVLSRTASDTIQVVDDDLGTFPLAAGEPVEVRIEGSTFLVGTLTIRAASPLEGSVSAPLTADASGLTVTGGGITPSGWTVDAALAALQTTQPVFAGGTRVDLQVSGLPACIPGDACPATRIVSLESEKVRVAIESVGTTLRLMAGDRTYTLATPQSAEFPLSIELRHVNGDTILRASAGPSRATVVLPVPLGETHALTLGSLDPASTTSAGVRFRNLRIVPLERVVPITSRTARLAPVRRDAHAYVVYASTDPAAVRARTAPSVLLPLATLRPNQTPVVTLTGLQNTVPVHIAAAVTGPGGEVSALSELRTVVPTVDPDAPAPPAIPAFAPQGATAQAGALSTTIDSVPASRLFLSLGEQLVLDPSNALPAGEPDLLVSWSIGHDANILTEPTAQHVYVDPGVYRPTIRFQDTAGKTVVAAAPPVLVADAVSATTLRLTLDPPTGRIPVGGTIGIRGTFRDASVPDLPQTWRLRLDYGDGSPIDDDSSSLRAAFLSPSAQVPLAHTYTTEGTATIVVDLEDEQGVRLAAQRFTVLVGDVRDVPGVVAEVTPLDAQPGSAIRARLVDSPSSLAFLAWDFGDTPSTDDRTTLPTAPGLGVFRSPDPMVTTPVQTLGDLPIFMRVRTPGGSVSLSSSSVHVSAPDASFELQQQLLFGSIGSGAAGRSIALSRIGPDGKRTYLADVQIDRSGFVMLPVSPAAEGQAVAAIRDAERAEVLAVDGVGFVRATLPLTVEPSLRGFSVKLSADEGTGQLDVDFDPDVTVSSGDLRRGILVSEFAPGVTLGTADGSPALMKNGAPLLTFDIRRIPRLAPATELRVLPSDSFAPLRIELRDGTGRLALIRLHPDGPVRSEGGGEGFVLSATGALAATIDQTAAAALRPGDRLVLAARDARGILSRDLASLTVTADDLAAGRAPALGVSSPGSRQLLPLTTTGGSLHANDVQPTLFGIAPPGSTVTVTTHSETQSYTIQADERGTWRLTPAKPLQEGAHTVDVIAGGTSATIPLNVDLTPPAAPEVTGVDGSILTGWAEPGTTVAYSVPGREDVGAVITGTDGRFRLTARSRVSLVFLKAIDAAGNISPTTKLDISGAALAPTDTLPWGEALSFGLALGGVVGLVLLLWAARRQPFNVSSKQ